MALQQAPGGAGKAHVAKYGGDIRRRGSHQHDRFGQKRRLDRVVTIERQNKLGLSSANAEISCCRQAAVILADDAGTALQFRQFTQRLDIG